MNKKCNWKNTLHTNKEYDSTGYLLDFAQSLGYDYAAYEGRVYDVYSGRDICSVEALDDERNALVRIANEEYPNSGKFWGWGEPKSYGSAYGADGERDFMIRLAKDALGD